MAGMAIAFDNTFARELPNFYVARLPSPVRAPRLRFFNQPLADELGLDLASQDESAMAAIFAGNTVPDGAEPLAQAYAGHQFGGFVPQLGDGRALLLGEVIDRHGNRRDIAYKGSGRTEFARGGDGRAAVGPMLREVLVSESMHALGIPTTRALAVATTGEDVHREQLLPGAVLTRVAASHLRVGTFQFYAARGDVDSLSKLALYTIARHDPELVGAAQPFLGLLRNVVARQAALVAQWMNVGFIHGVMNTDNMTISGETIDYGPCAFIEAYDPAAVFSSIDHHGRYAFANQPRIAAWNLARFAETLLPLIADDSDQAVALATEVIAGFDTQYQRCLLRGQRAKLGLRRAEADDGALADDWLSLLHAHHVDFTLAWRRLADTADGIDAPLRALFADVQGLEAWLVRWHARCASEADSAPNDRAQAMRGINPLVIARNHRVEDALAAASDNDDLAPFDRLLAAVRQPYAESAAQAPFAEPAPAAVTAGYRTFCGT
ncbi:MAG: YdiU family protein [Burkholderiales bacterium]|nr:YdiU family protein [Burkholderiales bacterium]